MGTTCVPRQTHCSFLKCCKWRYFVYNRRRLDPRLFPWQRRNGCHLVLFMMNIDGAKFEEHRFNTTIILLRAPYFFTLTTQQSTVSAQLLMKPVVFLTKHLMNLMNGVLPTPSHHTPQNARQCCYTEVLSLGHTPSLQLAQL